jgi:transcription-repair coupling factor (superfamily II helicase)
VENGKLPALCTGVSLIHKALICSSLNSIGGFPLLVLCESESAALNLFNDLTSLGVEAGFFPYRDFEFSGAVSGSREFEHKRIDTLSALADGAIRVAVTSIEAAATRTIPLQTLKELSFSVSVGESIEIDKLCEKLSEAGYVRAETVDGIGQYAKRGGILDIYTADSKSACRIEFWGDEIEEIAEIDGTSLTSGVHIALRGADGLDLAPLALGSGLSLTELGDGVWRIDATVNGLVATSASAPSCSARLPCFFSSISFCLRRVAVAMR